MVISKATTKKKKTPKRYSLQPTEEIEQNTKKAQILKTNKQTSKRTNKLTKNRQREIEQKHPDRTKRKEMARWQT